MTRPPFLPTLFVAAAVAAMIALGVWQLQRAEWKDGLIAELEASGGPQPMTIDCRPDDEPEVRAGASFAGESGYRYLIACKQSGMQVDIGWSKNPGLVPRLSEARFSGMTAVNASGRRDLLVLDEPVPPLGRSAVPSVADLPNNHRSYAAQWFFFAAAAAVIYILALRRRRREGRSA